MADLESLNIPNITDMSNDEALELLRQIRLSRRIPIKSTTVTTRKPAKATTPSMSATQAAEILKLLTGGK